MLAMLGQSLFQTMSTQRFGQQFVGKVANPSDLLLLSKAKPEPKRRSAAAAGDDGTSCWRKVGRKRSKAKRWATERRDEDERAGAPDAGVGGEHRAGARTADRGGHLRTQGRGRTRRGAVRHQLWACVCAVGKLVVVLGRMLSDVGLLEQRMSGRLDDCFTQLHSSLEM